MPHTFLRLHKKAFLYSVKKQHDLLFSKDSQVSPGNVCINMFYFILILPFKFTDLPENFRDLFPPFRIIIFVKKLEYKKNPCWPGWALFSTLKDCWVRACAQGCKRDPNGGPSVFCSHMFL